MDKASVSPKLNVRLEEDLRCLLEAAAERSLRSLNAEIRYRLRRSLEQPEPAAA
jgi:predicted HicB family RNase H-like nuclease